MNRDSTLKGLEILKPGRQFSLLYQQEEEQRDVIHEIITKARESNWRVLYLFNQSFKKALEKYRDETKETKDHLLIEPVKDFFLSHENLSSQQAIERIEEEERKAFYKGYSCLCPIIEMDYTKDGEEELLSFEILLKKSLSKEKILPISQYHLPASPTSFLSYIVLFHQYLIIDHTICKNPSPLRERILEASIPETLFYNTLDAIKNMQNLEKRLSWTRDLCLTLFEEFPNPLFLANSSGEIIDFNHVWLDFTGRSLKEERGWGWLEGLKEEERDSFFHLFQERMKRRKPFETEFYLRHHSGEYKYLLCSSRPITDSAGRFSGFLFSCYDITMRREKEEKRLEQLERELLSLDQISGEKSTSITASSLGLSSIKEGLPDVFFRLTDDYQRLLEDTIKERIFGEKNQLEEEKRAFVSKIGFLQSSPRDLIDIHSSVLERVCQDTAEEKAIAYVEEGRILALEIMGYLVSFYRRHCSSFKS